MTNLDNKPTGRSAAAPLWTAVILVGLLMIVAGTVAPIFAMGRKFPGFSYVYAIGAGVLLIGRLFTLYRGPVVRLKRLSRIETWSALFFCVAAFFMFYSPSGSDWLAFTLAGAVIQVYSSIMIQIVSKKG